MSQKPHHPGYYVWNPDGHYPTYRHISLNSASVEAKRLAAENPGAAFFVMAAAAVAYSPKVDPKFELVENQPSQDADDQIPF